jgi:hypothetical protein
MKAPLAIAILFALAALTSGTVGMTLTSSAVLAGGGGPDNWCGALVCPPKPFRRLP